MRQIRDQANSLASKRGRTCNPGLWSTCLGGVFLLRSCKPSRRTLVVVVESREVAMNARVRAASRAAQRQNQEGEATCLEQQHISRQSLDGHDEVRRERQTLHLRPLDGLLLSHNDASVPPVRERASDRWID